MEVEYRTHLNSQQDTLWFGYCQYFGEMDCVMMWYYIGQVTELQLSGYLVLLSADSNTR